MPATGDISAECTLLLLLTSNEVDKADISAVTWITVVAPPSPSPTARDVDGGGVVDSELISSTESEESRSNERTSADSSDP